MHSFDTLMALEPTDAGWRATIPDDWMQGRSTFGGLTAALAVRAMTIALQGDDAPVRPLISLDVAFVGPAGGEIEIETEVLRNGRNMTHAAATLRSGEAIAVRAHAVFGAPRTSEIQLDPPAPHPSAPRDSVQPWPFIPGLTPAFTRHFEFRATEGDPPFSGSSRATMGGYTRFASPPSPEFTVEAMVALADAWPGPMTPLGTRPFPASTVRMSIQILSMPPDGFAEDFWFRSECVAASGGYATVVGYLYAGQTPVVWMEQRVAYFDR